MRELATITNQEVTISYVTLAVTGDISDISILKVKNINNMSNHGWLHKI